MRHAGGRGCEKMPAVRSKRYVLARGSESVAGGIIADDISRHLRNTRPELPALHCKFACDGARERTCFAWRRASQPAQPGRHQRRRTAEHGRVVSLISEPHTALAVCYCRI